MPKKLTTYELRHDQNLILRCLVHYKDAAGNDATVFFAAECRN